MTLLFWGITISTVGKVILGVGVLMAHGKISHEHRIDKQVLTTFHTERILTIAGLLLIFAGYLLEIYFYGFLPFAPCEGSECFASVVSSFAQ